MAALPVPSRHKNTYELRPFALVVFLVMNALVHDDGSFRRFDGRARACGLVEQATRGTYAQAAARTIMQRKPPLRRSKLRHAKRTHRSARFPCARSPRRAKPRRAALPYPCLSSTARIARAMAAITGTVTLLPSCLYRCVSESGSLYESGKPCRRAHSRGVSLRMSASLICP